MLSQALAMPNAPPTTVLESILEPTRGRGREEYKPVHQGLLLDKLYVERNSGTVIGAVEKGHPELNCLDEDRTGGTCKRR